VRVGSGSGAASLCTKACRLLPVAKLQSGSGGPAAAGRPAAAAAGMTTAQAAGAARSQAVRWAAKLTVAPVHCQAAHAAARPVAGHGRQKPACHAATATAAAAAAQFAAAAAAKRIWLRTELSGSAIAGHPAQHVRSGSVLTTEHSRQYLHLEGWSVVLPVSVGRLHTVLCVHRCWASGASRPATTYQQR
jgi:hypothetical protein